MNEYPRMMYHGDGRQAVAVDEDAERGMGDGWGRTPHDVHRSDSMAAHLAPAVSGQDDLADKIATTVIERLRAEGLLPSLTDAEIDPGEAAPVRRRGRPPGSRNRLTEGVEGEQQQNQEEAYHG